MRWLPAAVSAALLAGAAGVFVIAPAGAQTPGTISACINSNHQLTHVTTGSPLACPSQQPVSWPGNVPGTPGPTSASPSPSPSPTSASPSPSPSVTGFACTTSAEQGSCGPYDSYAGITDTTSSTYVGNNMWNAQPGYTSTLSANSPGDWQVVANMPAGNGAVISYPSIGANYGWGNSPNPISGFSSIVSSFSENMHANSGTSAWAAYDIWTNPGTSFNNPGNEVMIQTDFAGNGPCTYQAVAQFGGSGGVPVQTWGLCVLGTELIWKLAPTGAAAGDSATINESSGSVDILAMLTWLENHGYMAQGSGLGGLGYGWEIASTGGQDETFTVSGYTLHPVCATAPPGCGQ